MTEPRSFNPKPLIERPARLAILISGSGRTLENLAHAIENGELEAAIVLVISSRSKVKGIERANWLGIPCEVIRRSDFADDAAFSEANFARIRDAGANLVCLAGYLRLLSIPPDYEGRVINIHPALLPEFGGRGMYGERVHEAVLRAGRTESGCTVHYADNEYDHGEIILQRRVPVHAGDTPATLADRIFEQECIAYPQAIRLLQGTEEDASPNE